MFFPHGFSAITKLDKVKMELSVNELFEIANTFRQTDISHSSMSEYFCRFCPREGYATIDDQTYPAGTKIMNHDGIPCCVSCGRTDMEFVSDEPEWTSGNDPDVGDPSRVGAPVNTTLYSAEWGSGTIMSINAGGSFANKRLARINFHTSMNHRDRALHHAYDNLDQIGRIVLQLPDAVMLQAKIMYKKFSETLLTRGAIRLGIKANCILRACQDAGIPRTTQEVADAFEIPSRDISRTADMFRETIPEVQVMTGTKPSHLIARIFNQVTCVPDDMRGRIRQKVIRQCEKIECHPSLMGKTPRGIAAAILYQVLSEFGLERSTSAGICEVSLPTLNKLDLLVKKISTQE